MEKAKDLRNLSPEELKDKVDQLKLDLMQHRFQAKTGKLERLPILGDKKRDIARVLTIMNEKNREAQSE
ncbi:MAG: 50S ribosomal protein L29 [Candidatus Omnitrophota bacterium]|nr:50S ribosomal protein L29 [Candidatus Omnitrophota bacterium]